MHTSRLIIAAAATLLCAWSPAAEDAGAHGRAVAEEARERGPEHARDGAPSAEERAARHARAQERLERLREEHPERYARLDRDSDGEVSRDEIHAARERLRGHRDGESRRDGDAGGCRCEDGGGDRRERIRDRVDTDQDGRLSEEERTAAREKLGERLEERHGDLFARLDRDGDGSLSPEEFRHALRKLHERRQDRHGGDGEGRDRPEHHGGDDRGVRDHGAGEGRDGHGRGGERRER